MDALVAAAECAYLEAAELQAVARSASFDDPFTVYGNTYIKHTPGKRSDRSRVYVLHDGSQKRIDIPYTVMRAFMTWTIIEVLRHTGIRIEEMLELTHLSIKQYRKPDGTVIPLLQIAPSKNDQERIFPCSPELTTTLARLVEFISIDGRVPLCCRIDKHERHVSAPMPHLIQIREGGRPRVINDCTIRKWLSELANIRCDFCQANPAQAARLDEIRNNLCAQVEEAERNQWLGDVNQLRITIDHADRKAARLAAGIAEQVPLVTAGRP
jgi:hypothetical protein